MRFLILFVVSFASTTSWALRATVQCDARAYSCGANGCGWQTVVNLPARTVDLVEDKAFPTPGYPYEVFRGQFRTAYDNHILTLDIVFSQERADQPPFVSAVLQATGVTAEATGRDTVYIALRNQNYGRGFYCSGIGVVP